MKTKFQGRDIEVEEVDVLSSNEPWSEYQLGDGTFLSIKLVLVRVLRSMEVKTGDGQPLYLVNSQNVVKTKGAK